MMGVEIRVILITVLLVLAGCASHITVREGIGGGATAVKVLATASVAKYADCVNSTEPGSPGEERCTHEKNERGAHLVEMAKAVDGMADAIACVGGTGVEECADHPTPEIEACRELRHAREAAAALRAALETYLPSPHLATVEFLIQSSIPECDV